MKYVNHKGCEQIILEQTDKSVQMSREIMLLKEENSTLKQKAYYWDLFKKLMTNGAELEMKANAARIRIPGYLDDEGCMKTWASIEHALESAEGLGPDEVPE